MKINHFDLAFIENDIDATLSNWCDLFFSTLSDHVPNHPVKKKPLFTDHNRRT